MAGKFLALVPPGKPLKESSHFQTCSLLEVFFWSVACRILVPDQGSNPCMPPAVEVQSLNHWTAGEVPSDICFELAIPRPPPHTSPCPFISCPWILVEKVKMEARIVNRILLLQSSEWTFACLGIVLSFRVPLYSRGLPNPA